MTKSSAALPAQDAPLPELTRVKARKSIRQGNESVPEGTVGTIVHVYEDGDAFEVEFSVETGAVLLVQRADLETI